MNAKPRRDIKEGYWSAPMKFAFPKHALVARKLPKTSEFSLPEEPKSQTECVRQAPSSRGEMPWIYIYEQERTYYPMLASSIRVRGALIASSSGIVAA